MDNQHKKKKGLSRLFEIAGQRKGLLILAGVLSAISAALMLLPYLSVYKILEELLRNASDVSLIDKALMVRWAWIALGGLLAGLALLYAALMCSHSAAFNILYGMRIHIAKKLGTLSLGYLNNSTTGALKKTMDQNVEKVENFVAHSIPDLVNVLATLAVIVFIFFSINVWMALACVVVILLSVFLQFSAFFSGVASKNMKIYYDIQERLSASAVQYVRGMSVVKVFGQSVKSFRQFSGEIAEYKRLALNICDTYEKSMVGFIVLLNSMVTILIPIGLLLYQNAASGIAFAAVWLFFIIMGPGVTSPVYKLMHLGGSTKEIDEGVERIDKILEEKSIPETDNPQIPQGYSIEFDNVSFAYANVNEATRTQALKDVSFTARQGEITALVGPSGGGKSTIANLIPRFYDVDSGEIRIGGVNVKNIATEKLMDMVSFVFQDTFLFYDTIYENIAVGKTDATKEDVIAAAKAAQCHEFIEAMPNGYQTRIGEKGVYVSGGEAQRICVARAILKNAPILVLDEATAFADPENEHKMQQALTSLMKDKTVIIIAHRLSSVISANQILVIKEGRMVQQGKHDELTSTEGVYQNMWNAYTSAYSWKLNN